MRFDVYGSHCSAHYDLRQFNVLAGVFFSHKYAKLQSSARQCIEQAWGMVVNRFRIFKGVSEICSSDWIQRFGALIQAGLILHNICLVQKEQIAKRASFGIDAEDQASPGFQSPQQWYVNDPADIGIQVSTRLCIVLL
jgi:hypothetical protein